MTELEKGITNKYNNLARAVQEVAKHAKIEEPTLIL
jgi:hypothetical protein